MKPEWIAGTLLVVILSVMATASYINHLQRERDVAQAKVTQAQLEAEGYKKALAATPTEVVKLVPQLVTKTVTKLIHDKAIEAVASASGTGTTTLVVPCGASSEPLEPQGVQDVPVKLDVSASLLITRVRFGGAIDYKGDLTGRATYPNGQHQDLDFKPLWTVAMSKDITDALDAREREGGWLKRHTKLLCPGAGVTYNPLDTLRPINVGVTCTYGFAWF